MFLIVALALVIASFLDGLSTIYMLRRGGWEVGTAWLLGRYPSKLRIFVLGGAVVCGELAILFALIQFVSRYCLLLAAAQAVSHLFYATRNYLNYRPYPVIR